MSRPDPRKLCPDHPPGVMYARFRPDLTRLAMPDVCCDLLWVRERLFLAGPASRGQPVCWPGEDIELVNIDPLAARAWLGVPLSHLVDRRIPLRDIEVAVCGPLEELFHSRRAASLVQTGVNGRQPPTRAAVAAVAIRGGNSIEAAASRIALTSRQLERIFADQFGLTPRLYRRIIRLRRALAAAASGYGLAESAIATGFADQSHFTREVQSLMGKSPRAVIPNVGKVQDAHVYAREY